MTREKVVNSWDYTMSKASCEYWANHRNEKYDDNAQIRDAFEAGAKWADSNPSDETYRRTDDKN